MTPGVGIEEREGAVLGAGAFSSAAELREVLDRLLSTLDADPVSGPVLRSAGVPHRFVFPDADVTLDVSGSEEAGHCLEWAFGGGAAEGKAARPGRAGDEEPLALELRMDSDVANRVLQGRENLAIAMARGRISVSCPHARNALTLLPAGRTVVSGYRELIERSYPHLVLHGVAGAAS